jgi:hypothetical protein
VVDAVVGEGVVVRSGAGADRVDVSTSLLVVDTEDGYDVPGPGVETSLAPGLRLVALSLELK